MSDFKLSGLMSVMLENESKMQYHDHVSSRAVLLDVVKVEALIAQYSFGVKMPGNICRLVRMHN